MQQQQMFYHNHCLCSYEGRDLTCMVPSLADSMYGLLVLSTSHLHARHHSHSVAVTLGHIEQW